MQMIGLLKGVRKYALCHCKLYIERGSSKLALFALSLDMSQSCLPADGSMDICLTFPVLMNIHKMKISRFKITEMFSYIFTRL